eukprot:gnl/TRDRNA2_/TRDRNA2_182277_c0_seq1.p1 gnl/TRDRNA2_/TRDRNA2_182277_c0~~gnl/TRDRNA2_/TRDRNA2_182277_c0_seq1.p1  ORF type:complete len:194 (+),score=20.78 gnl/TRDRNA2_/TRDRNA2_182277_c0_seq1:74-655(+)
MGNANQGTGRQLMRGDLRPIRSCMKEPCGPSWGCERLDHGGPWDHCSNKVPIYSGVRLISLDGCDDEVDNGKLPLDGFVWNPGFDPKFERKPSQLPSNQVPSGPRSTYRDAPRGQEGCCLSAFREVQDVGQACCGRSPDGRELSCGQSQDRRELREPQSEEGTSATESVPPVRTAMGGQAREARAEKPWRSNL